MAIVKMKHLRLAAMQSDREALLRLLQGMGCLEIEEPSVDWSDPEWAGLKSPDSGALSAARGGEKRSPARPGGAQALRKGEGGPPEPQAGGLLPAVF